MTLDELQEWIVSDEGLGRELSALRRLSAASSVGTELAGSDLERYAPDWKRLLLAGSILSLSESAGAIEQSLLIAQSAMQFPGDRSDVAEAGATILTQLANHRAVDLAIQRQLIDSDFSRRLGTTERMLLVRRELQQTIFPAEGAALTANRFQRAFWNALEKAEWVSASAPTASGKTYLVLQWLLNEFAARRVTFAVFMAPTWAAAIKVRTQRQSG